MRLLAQPSFVWPAGLPGSEPELVGGLLKILTDEGVEGVAFSRGGLILEDIVERRLLLVRGLRS